MRVALGQDGTAVLTGHRWSPYGVGLAIHKDTATGEGASKRAIGPAGASRLPCASPRLWPWCCRAICAPCDSWSWISTTQAGEAGPQAEDVSPYSDDDVRVLQPGADRDRRAQSERPALDGPDCGKKTLRPSGIRISMSGHSVWSIRPRRPKPAPVWPRPRSSGAGSCQPQFRTYDLRQE